MLVHQLHRRLVLLLQPAHLRLRECAVLQVRLCRDPVFPTGDLNKGVVPYGDVKVANREIRVWHFVIENGY
jgi:hypothetical protein